MRNVSAPRRQRSNWAPQSALGQWRRRRRWFDACTAHRLGRHSGRPMASDSARGQVKKKKERSEAKRNLCENVCQIKIWRCPGWCWRWRRPWGRLKCTVAAMTGWVGWRRSTSVVHRQGWLCAATGHRRWIASLSESLAASWRASTPFLNRRSPLGRFVF